MNSNSVKMLSAFSGIPEQQLESAPPSQLEELARRLGITLEPITKGNRFEGLIGTGSPFIKRNYRCD
jgi:hypothetical protein